MGGNRIPLLLTRNPNGSHAWADLAPLNMAQAHQVQLVDFNIVVQAVEECRGVALGRRMMLQDKLTSGQLVELFSELALAGNAFYWIVQTKGRRLKPAAQIFADWLIQVSKTFREGE